MRCLFSARIGVADFVFQPDDRLENEIWGCLGPGRETGRSLSRPRALAWTLDLVVTPDPDLGLGSSLRLGSDTLSLALANVKRCAVRSRGSAQLDP